MKKKNLLNLENGLLLIVRKLLVIKWVFLKRHLADPTKTATNNF
jgi:hypothetical protein